MATYNSIVVLSDGGSFDMADNVSVLLPTQNGETLINTNGDAACLDQADIIHNIPLREILDFYNLHHGTNL